MPLHTVRDWLGHTNIAQTSTYLESTLQALQGDAMRRLKRRARRGPAEGPLCNGVQRKVGNGGVIGPHGGATELKCSRKRDRPGSDGGIPSWGSRGRWFESSHPDQYLSVPISGSSKLCSPFGGGQSWLTVG